MRGLVRFIAGRVSISITLPRDSTPIAPPAWPYLSLRTIGPVPAGATCGSCPQWTPMNRSRLLPMAAVLFFSGAASADPATTPVPVVTPTDTAMHHHGGFYLRFAAGFSAYNEVVLHRTDSGENAPRTYVTGMGTGSELAIGGTLKPGLVLGGGFWGMTALATDVSTKNGGVPAGAAGGGASLGILGPFVDYYLDPLKGFHLQAGLGFAMSREVDPVSGKFNRDHVAGGIGAMFGVGNDWWVGDDWSVGVMGRVLAAGTTNKVDGLWYGHFVSAAPGVLFSVTYH